VGDADDHVLDQAIASSKAGHFSYAERLFRIFLLRQPKHARALNQFGILLAQIGRYEEAERYIRQAIRLGSHSGATFYNHGTILKFLQRPLEALEAFDKALAINPADPETWNNRGTVFTNLARYQEAIDDFDKAILLSADFAGAFSNKAKSLLLSGRHDEALAAYDKALALKPDLTEAWLGRASIFVHRKRHDEAVASFDKALTAKPDLAEAWLGRANACYQLKRYGDALAAYNQALALKPDFAEAWLSRGGIFDLFNRHGDALVAFDKALTAKPDLAEAWLGRGQTLQALNRPEEAIVAFRQALAKGADAEVIQYSLASLGAEAAPVTAPQKLITELFDRHADTFDEHLVGKLKYRAPDLLFDAMVCLVPSRKLDILDLGCGTGLVGARFHPLARTLTGVDFSSNMLGVARQRRIYDNLICSELTEFLRSQPNNFDLVIATDVFLYIGDLSGVFQGVQRALRDGGFFGFSVEISDEQDFVLRPNRHYAHSGAYLRKLTEDHGFALEKIESQVIRQDNAIDVLGYLAILRCS
jgi:predicted TPR repeat methyltransferase